MNFAAGVAVTRDITLLRPLSEGAMGHVWVARHAKLDRDVAVKFMAQKLARDRTMLSRFNREAEAAAQISSPHVVRILEHGTTDSGTPFIAMELLRGESLGDCLERLDKLSLDLAAAILRQVGSALDAAHARGIVHRDVKPDNLFLVDGPTQPLVKVLDFGMAKKMRKRDQSIVTATGVAVGTPDYMSPEQVLGAKDVDFRSDLWALAVVAYNMITGESAFEAATPHALFFTICKGSFTPLERHGGPPELGPWFERALQPAKEKRFGSAREMVLRFEAAVAEAKANGYTDDDSTQSLAPTKELEQLERFGAPPAPESKTNPRYERPGDHEDHLAATLDFRRGDLRADDIDDEDSDDGVPTEMIDRVEANAAIQQALADLGNPMGGDEEDDEEAPDSMTTVRDVSSYRIGDNNVSGYDKTVNSQRNPFMDELDQPPESESVPGLAKPRRPQRGDVYGDADESGPRPALAEHSAESSGQRISVNARRAEELTRAPADDDAASDPARPSAVADDDRKRNPLIMIGGLAAVAAVVIFVVTSQRPNTSAEVSGATAEPVQSAAPQPSNAARAEPAPAAPSTADAALPAAASSGAPAGAETGTITVICKPQCINVRLGDESMGPSPLLKKELPAGTHRLTLVRKGMSNSVVEVEVPAGEHVSRSFNLTPDATAAAAPSPASPTPAPPRPAPVETAAPAPQPEPQVVEDPYE